MKKKLVVFISIFAVLFLLGACGDKSENKEVNNEVPTITEDERIDSNQVVVTVNGEEVTGVIYNLVYAQLKLHTLQTGQYVPDEDIMESAIESVIDRQILLQDAREKGIEYTEEDAREHLAQIKEQSAEAYETLLEQYQITEEEFLHDIIFQMTLTDFLENHIEVTVTDEEVEQIYEEEKAQNENMPELVEIRDTLKRNIENRRMMESLQERVDDLRVRSEIERHL